jgi:hypothetical protein
LAVTALFASAAHAQLDAPVDEHPTVRSEIKHGYDTAKVCDSFDAEAPQLDGCISRVITQYRISHPNSSAFEAGANVVKWVVGARSVAIADRIPGNDLARQYAMYGKISVLSAEADLDVLANDLKITPDQVFEASGIPPSLKPASARSH